MGLREDDPRWRLVGGALLALYLGLIVATFQDYGVTLDEVLHADYGDLVLSWYRTGFHDRRVLSHVDLRYYGGLFDAVAAAATRVSPFGRMETRHLVAALAGLVGVVFTGLLAARLHSRLAGVLAGLLLALTPSYYGHSFLNPKDIPFAAAVVAALYFAVRWLEALPRVPWRRVVALGLAAGSALAVRCPGGYVLALLALVLAVWLALPTSSAAIGERGERGPRPAGAVSLAVRFAVASGLAYVFMLLWWPSAQIDPIGHPWRTLGVLTHFSWNNPVLFAGTSPPATELPRSYLLRMGWRQLPEFFLFALALTPVVAGWAIARRSGPRPPPERTLAYGLVASAAVVPLAAVIVGDAVVYDGIRQFLFVLPPLAVLAGCAVATLLGGRRRWVAAAVGSLLATGLAATAADMAALHPYEYVYYNRVLAGGLPGAFGAYETDYWGASFKEGLGWVAARYGDRPGAIRVATCAPPELAGYYLRPPFVLVAIDERPDLFVATTRWDCNRKLKGTAVFRVVRQGVPLLVVKEVSGFNR